MGWYGKNDKEDSYEEKLIRKVKKELKKQEEYDGGNARAIKASRDDEDWDDIEVDD